MATLAGATIASTYTQLLKLTSASLGADASAKYIEDGAGTDSALSLSTTRVGIGTASPSYRLDVQEASSGAVFSRIYNSTASSGAHAGLRASVNGVSGGDPHTLYEIAGVTSWSTGVDNDVGDYYKIAHSSDLASSTRLTIDNSGNVGIGTASPATVLHVLQGNVQHVAKFENVHGDGCQIQLANDSEIGYLIMDGLGGSGKLSLGMVGTVHANNLNIDSVGRVGIGTASPGALLHLESTSNNNPKLWIVGASTTADDQGGEIEFMRTDPDAHLTDNDIIGDISFLGRDHTDGDYLTAAFIRCMTNGTPAHNVMPAELSFHTNAGGTGATQRLTILANGDVGVGTSSPGANLATGTAGAVYLDVSGGGAPGILSLIRGVDNDNYMVGSVQFINSNNSDAATNNANGEIISEIMTRVETTDSNGGDDCGGHMCFSTKPDGGTLTERIRILDTGKIGIGESDPAYQLEVRNASGDCDITINCAADGDASLKLGENTKEAYGRVRYDANTDMLFLYTNNGIRQVIDSAGKVGIGTIAPEQKLHVQDGSIAIMKNSADTADGHLEFYKSRNATDGAHTVVQDDDELGVIKWYGSDGTDYHCAASIEAEVDGEPATGGDATDMPGRLNFATTTNGSGSPTIKMVVLNDGNVGIGVTDPAQLLEVAGTAGAFIQIDANSGGAGTDDAGITLAEAGTPMWYIYNNGGQSDALYVHDGAGAHGVYLPKDQSGVAWSDTSDLNLKTDIKVLPDALSKINKLRGVNFKWKKYKEGASNPYPISDEGATIKMTDEEWDEVRAKGDTNRVGVIAQEVHAVLPEAVDTNVEGNWGVAYSSIIPLLIEAVKELTAKVEALESK